MTSIDFSRVTVVKLGGSIFDSRDSTLGDIVGLPSQGQPLVVVHGGANMVTRWLADQGVKSQFYQGERITDRKSLEVVTAVLAGLANKETVAAILAHGGRAVGISGVDGALVEGRVRDEALGYIGSVSRINPAVLMALLAAGFTPVVSPVSLHAGARKPGDPLLLNINGDTVAGDIAAAVEAKKLVFLTDVDGLRGADGHTISRLTPAEAQDMLDSGVATGGMIPKLKACLVAAAAGVSCHIVDGRKPHALADAVAGVTSGTVVAGK